jgi:hypothetical protein
MEAAGEMNFPAAELEIEIVLAVSLCGGLRSGCYGSLICLRARGRRVARNKNQNEHDEISGKARGVVQG